MYVLIGGAGLVGQQLARQLLDQGHTVAVVDQDPQVCNMVRDRLGAMAFEGSAVGTDVLIEAGICRADAVAAVLRQDALNLALVTLARHYGVSRIISRIRQRDFIEPMRFAGAHHIISTVDLAVSTMVNAIECPQVESMLHFEQGQIEVFKLTLDGQSPVIGRSVAAIAQDHNFPSSSLIIGYQPHPQADLVIPSGNTVLEADATVLLATKPGLVQDLVNFLMPSLANPLPFAGVLHQ